MRRILWLLSVLSIPTPCQVSLEDFYKRLLRFDKPYEIMIHTVCGWPERLESPTPPICDPYKGHINQEQYLKSRDAAKRFYDLGEPK